MNSCSNSCGAPNVSSTPSKLISALMPELLLNAQQTRISTERLTNSYHLRALIASASYRHLNFFKMPVQKLKFGWCNKEGWCSHGCQRLEVVAIEVRTSLFREIQMSQTPMLTPTVLVRCKLLMDSYGIDF